MATTQINFVKKMAGVIIPTNHSLALLKSYYRNRYRRLDTIANSDNLRSYMCMKCSSPWQDGFCDVKISSVKKKKINITKKLKAKSKKRKNNNKLIICCTVCKNTSKMNLKNLHKIKRKNINKSVNVVKINALAKPSIDVKVNLKKPQNSVQQKNTNRKLLSNKVMKTKHKNMVEPFKQKNKTQQNQKINVPIVAKISNKKKNSILHLAALLQTNVKQDSESKNKLQKLLK